MTAITIEEIQRDFGSYLRQVRNGARILILEADRPVAELRPIAAKRPDVAPEQITLEPEIQQVYSELRDLVARSAEDPSLGPEIERARRRLHDLQARVAVSAAEAEPRGAVQIEAEIDQVYDDLRELVARAADDPKVVAEIERKRGQLHALKVEEAAIFRHRAEAMRRLEPGEGDRLLRHAEGLLAR